METTKKTGKKKHAKGKKKPKPQIAESEQERKRKLQPEEQPSSSSEEESDDEPELTITGNMQDEASSKSDEPKSPPVELCFDFCDPHEKYFHGIRALVDQIIPRPVVDTSGISDMICEQASVGTVICAADEVDVFGFITIINTKFRKDNPAVAGLTQWLTALCPGVEDLLEDASCGVVLQQRMMNLPLQLVPHLHTSLMEDFQWATENEITEEHRQQFSSMKRLLVLSPCQVVQGTSGGASSSTSSKKKGKGKKKKVAGAGEEGGVQQLPMGASVFYDHFEDDVFAAEAESKYTVKVPTMSSEAGSTKPTTKGKWLSLLVLTLEQYKSCIPNISELVSNAT